MYVTIELGTFLFILLECDKTVLPRSGAEESGTPAGCDVTLSSEGS